jgi:hypothetical protein
MATVQDRTHAVNGLNNRQQGARSGPEAPAHAPCSAGRDADLCHSQICPASNGNENTMRAVTVTEYGAAPAVAEMPTPQPGAGQVLIRLRAAGMNPMDGALASRRLQADAGDIPDGARSRWRRRGRATRARGVEVFRRRRSVRPVADRAAWLGGKVRRLSGRSPVPTCSTEIARAGCGLSRPPIARAGTASSEGGHTEVSEDRQEGCSWWGMRAEGLARCGSRRPPAGGCSRWRCWAR